MEKLVLVSYDKYQRLLEPPFRRKEYPQENRTKLTPPGKRLIDENKTQIENKKLQPPKPKDQEAYSMTRQARRKFPRSRVIVNGIDSQWDMDFMDMVSLAKHNDGYKYVLVTIDVFSRFAHCQPLRSKSGADMTSALQRILTGSRKPRMVRTDRGMEFRAKDVNKLLQEQHIHHFYALNTETKAGYAEILIKTLKHKLFRYLLKHNSKRYIDILQGVVYSYNHTVHRSLGNTPASVTKRNEGEMRLQQFMIRTKSTKPQRKQPYKYKVGQTVRISHIRNVFDQEYSQKWTGKLFTIHNRFKREGLPIYRLKDWSGDVIEGSFYEAELQAVNVDESTEYRVEKVLERRTSNKQKEVLVRWLHWPSKYDSWIPERDLKRYSKDYKMLNMDYQCYLVSGSSRQNIMYVTNVVCSGDLGCSINLRDLCYQLTNVRCDPTRFSGLIWQHRSIGGNCLVFSNGKINCNGKARSLQEGRKRVRCYARVLQRLGCVTRLRRINITTASAFHTLSSPLNLVVLVQDRHLPFEPELFPTVNFRVKGKVNGKVVITGIKKTSDIKRIINPTLNELELYTT